MSSVQGLMSCIQYWYAQFRRWPIQSYVMFICPLSIRFQVISIATMPRCRRPGCVTAGGLRSCWVICTRVRQSLRWPRSDEARRRISWSNTSWWHRRTGAQVRRRSGIDGETKRTGRMKGGAARRRRTIRLISRRCSSSSSSSSSFSSGRQAPVVLPALPIVVGNYRPARGWGWPERHGFASLQNTETPRVLRWRLRKLDWNI